MTRSRRMLIAAVWSLLASGSAAAQAVGDLTGEWLRISENERDPANVGGRPDRDDAVPGVGSAASGVSGDALPLNDSARLASETNPGRHSRIEDQCLMYPPEFLMVGSFPRTVLIEVDRDPEDGEVTAYRYRGDRIAERIIFMDGRARPSAYARHTPAGFSTGRWEGGALVVETTHLQWFWEERSNIPYSDSRTLTERFERIGDVLTQTMTTHDPAFLLEPVTRSRQFSLATAPEGLPDQRCSITVELAAQPRGYVPHYLPGTNPGAR